MLLLQSLLIGKPIASVQVGHRIGIVSGLVINPDKLTITALEVSKVNAPQPHYLFVEDIVELHRRGILINHNNELMEAEGLVRLEKLLKISFAAIGKKVKTESGKRAGTVIDYIIQTNSWEIQKLHTQPSLVKMLSSPDRIIHRSQIKRVTDKLFIIKDATVKDELNTSQKIMKQFSGVSTQKAHNSSSAEKS